MTTLEIRYRRLLRAYPAGHRDAYEEEMIGVLMADAEPGRRFPAPADVLDLLRAGLTARLGRSWQSGRTGWRDAAGVTGLLVALVMAGIASGRLVEGLRLRFVFDDPMRAYGMDGLLLLDPAARTLVWAAVAAAGLAGLRRTAAGLAAVSLLVETATLLWWWDLAPWQSLRLAWAPMTALLTLAVLILATRGRPIRTVVTAKGGRSAIALRAVALTVAVLAVPVVFRQSWDWMNLALAVDLTPGIITKQVIVLIATPVVTFAAGLAALGPAERFAARGRGQVRAHE